MAKKCRLAVSTASSLIKSHIRKLRLYAPVANTGDVEAIHDLRVVTRRLRVCLREHSDVFKEKPRLKLQDQIRGLTRTLGLPRELDVTLATMAKHEQAFTDPMRTRLSMTMELVRARRDEAIPSLAEVSELIASEEFDRDLIRLFGSLHKTNECYLEWAVTRLDKRFSRVWTYYETWRANGEEQDLHGVRIGLKQLRYAAETYESLYGKKLAAFLQELKVAQEALGDWNDLRVLRSYVVEANATPEETAPEGLNELLNFIDTELVALLVQVKEQLNGFFSPSNRKRIQKLIDRPKVSCCLNGNGKH